ncbi:hypothetical protein Tco_1425450 [Tanacetum coccineum]
MLTKLTTTIRYKRVKAFETALEGSLSETRDERCKVLNYMVAVSGNIIGVLISSGNSLRVISIFDYTTIVVYDGLMRVTDGNKVQMNIGV